MSLHKKPNLCIKKSQYISRWRGGATARSWAGYRTERESDGGQETAGELSKGIIDNFTAEKQENGEDVSRLAPLLPEAVCRVKKLRIC